MNPEVYRVRRSLYSAGDGPTTRVPVDVNRSMPLRNALCEPPGARSAAARARSAPGRASDRRGAANEARRRGHLARARARARGQTPRLGFFRREVRVVRAGAGLALALQIPDVPPRLAQERGRAQLVRVRALSEHRAAEGVLAHRGGGRGDALVPIRRERGRDESGMRVRMRPADQCRGPATGLGEVLPRAVPHGRGHDRRHARRARPASRAAGVTRPPSRLVRSDQLAPMLLVRCLGALR